jgi:hypothetical protein
LLKISRTINDKLGEAKANGNIGNTLKVLGQFDEALYYCQQHLKISTQLSDKVNIVSFSLCAVFNCFVKMQHECTAYLLQQACS